jgi:UDP-glucose 4-epimerase
LKYLVTGGTGFIGSHLCEALINRGDKIVVLDDFSTGKNVLPDSAEVIMGSILDSDLLIRIIPTVDEVLHLAAAVGVLNIVNKPLESLITNIKGTQQVLEVCDEFKKPILITSTSEVYGKNNLVPLNEQADRVLGSPLLSRWSYSEAKALDESMAYFYYLEKSLPVKLVRFFNTVGPRQVGSYGMVLPRFIDSALKGDPLNVYGNGMQTRCFAHVHDAVRALLLVIDSPQAIGEVFNVGNNQQISIMDLAKKVISVTGSSSSIEMVAYEKAYPAGFEDMERRVPDISKIERVLGWKPQIGLEQIIKDIAAHNAGAR